MSYKLTGMVGNLLSENIASGTDTDAATTGFTPQSVAIESSTDFAWKGTRSLKVTAASGNNRAVIGGIFPLDLLGLIMSIVFLERLPLTPPLPFMLILLTS